MATTTKKANQNYSAKLADGRTVTVKDGVKSYSGTATTKTKNTPSSEIVQLSKDLANGKKPTVPTSNKPMATPTPTPTSSYNGVSVVDFLKSTGGDSSFAARAQQAVKLGIVKNADQYTGSAAQNTSLLEKLRSGAKTTPTAVTNPNSAQDYINGAQDTDIAQAEASDAPPTRNSPSSELLANFYKETGITSLVPEFSGETPNYEATYEQMRKDNGIEGLEQSINEYDSLEQDIQARLRERVDSEEGKAVAMNVISGRISEAEKQEYQRLDEIGRAKQRAVNQLQTANNVIETMMNLKQMDYTVAKDTYDREFSRNTQLFSIFKGMEEFDMSVDEKDRAAAVSNLNIMYSAIQDGGMDVSTLDAATEAKITSLELKAGLPSGFYKNIAITNPEGKILSTTTRTSGGMKYADVIMQNADGSFSTQQIKLGADSSGANATETDDKDIKAFRSDAAGLIQKLGVNEISWAAAFNSMKAKYPQASNELIDATLNKEAYYEVQ